MKIKGIPDESIAASSSKSADNSPQFARLDGKKAWCSAPTDKEPHIQINLVEPKSITGVTTQGSFFDWAWITKYEVKYLEKKNLETLRRGALIVICFNAFGPA